MRNPIPRGKDQRSLDRDLLNSDQFETDIKRFIKPDPIKRHQLYARWMRDYNLDRPGELADALISGNGHVFYNKLYEAFHEYVNTFEEGEQ